MAFVSDIHLSDGGLKKAVAQKAQEAANAWKKWRLYRRTRAELASLSDRELADIGLNRSMISSVAYEAAYGKTD